MMSCLFSIFEYLCGVTNKEYMVDGEEFHIFEEKPLRFTEKGFEELLKSITDKIPKASNDILLYGTEIWHVTNEGLMTQIPVNSKEGWEIYNKEFNEKDI